ncbi:MAG: response regulator [Oscillospiraceae bacterium]|nr:response regulator [Oscillospiraceae bacterium]
MEKNEKKQASVFEGDVLLCEDNEMNNELITKRLMKAGLSVTRAENGKIGLETVLYRIQNHTKPFDLIFMDIHMPVMDGLEAADEIQKLNTGTPIIAVSPNNTPAEMQKYAEHGMKDCLNKPFTSQELFSCLMKYLPFSDCKKAGTDEKQDAEKDKALINKLIFNFTANNQFKYNEITEAIDTGDIKSAHRLAHNLKSNAGNLGKTKLQKAAEEIEKMLATEENLTSQFSLSVLKTELDAVLDEFAPLIAEMSYMFEREDEKANADCFDLQKALLVLEKLENLLEGGDLECLNLIGCLRKIPGSGKLIQQIEYYEFGKAAKTLEELKEELRSHP